MSLRNRRSPSGPPTEMQIPIYGSNALNVGTEYLTVGEMGTSITEVDGQFMIPQNGFLTALIVQNVSVAGTVPGETATYNVRKNGVLIVRPAVLSPPIPAAPATGILAHTSQEPLEIQIGVGVKGPAPSDSTVTPAIPVTVGDRISVEVVTAAVTVSPVVRMTLLYAPGGPY